MDGAAVTFRGTERFQLRRLLGRGGMGIVYEAFDDVNATAVALKLLPVVDPDLLLRFKREFRTVADIRHRNLVRLGELVAHDAQWFFTMELVDGVDFVKYIRGDDAREPAAANERAPIGPRGAAADTVPATAAPRPAAPTLGLRVERLRPALAQLAEALVALHEAGCVHRDVKPSNVLVTPAGRVVLLDFGLASTSTIETTLLGAGTPAYMAPEQAAQAPVTMAADWYSFGVILFELLAGGLPFKGLPHEILYRKQYDPPPRLRSAAPGAPAELADLCDRLLATDPAARPQGAEVLALLSASRPASPRQGASERVKIVGREPELDQLAAALRRVRDGAGPAAVVVHGESGVGKSALVQAFLDSTKEGGDCIVLTARCYERELVPFKAVDGLVDALTRELRSLAPSSLEAVLPARAETLLQAFPVLGRVDALALAKRGPLDRDPGEVRVSMFAAFRELLAGLGRQAPILAVIDDLQWADGDSLALLAEALSGPVGPRLLLLGTLRPTAAERDASGRLLPLTVDEQVLRLSNLPQPVARELARRLLADTGSPDVERDSAAVARESFGHPLFLRELARTAHLRAVDDRPVTLDGVLRDQIEVLSSPSVRLLRALAIAGAPLALVVARRATELEGAAMVSALDELRTARLVLSSAVRDEEAVDIAHDRIRQVLRTSTAAAEAGALHASLALAFEDSGDPLRAAEHWRDAGRDDRAAVHFAAAGRQAVEVLAFDRAANAFHMALAIPVWSEDEKRELTIGLADALSNAGRGAAAAPHYLSAAELAIAPRALELRRRATEELLRSGHVDEGREVAARTLADAGLEFPRSAIRALLWQRALLKLRGFGFKRRKLEEVAPRELARIDLCWSLSSGLALTEPVQGAHFQTRSLLLALRAGEVSRVARGIAGDAAYAAALGDARGAARRLAQAQTMAQAQGDPHTSGIVSLMCGLASHLGGRFAPALEHLDAAERTFRGGCVGTAWELNATRQFSLECLYYLGELARFQASATEGIKEAEDRGSVYASTTLRTGLTNVVSLIRDDPERAHGEVEDAMRRWTSRGYHVQHWYELMARTQIHLYRGDGSAAWELVEQRWPSLERSGLLRLRHTRIVASHLKARAAVAASLGASAERKSRLLTIARDCARRTWREGGGWNRVLAAASHAGVERASGRQVEAEAWLRRLISLANGEGLALHAAAALVSVGDAAGTEWMAAHGVQAPALMAGMLLPGCASATQPGGGPG